MGNPWGKRMSRDIRMCPDFHINSFLFSCSLLSPDRNHMDMSSWGAACLETPSKYTHSNQVASFASPILISWISKVFVSGSEKRFERAAYKTWVFWGKRDVEKRHVAKGTTHPHRNIYINKLALSQHHCPSRVAHCLLSALEAAEGLAQPIGAKGKRN